MSPEFLDWSLDHHAPAQTLCHPLHVVPEISTVDAYIASFPADVQVILRHVRRRIASVLPNSEETIRYRIPTFIVDGRSVVHCAGWKHHISVYPVPHVGPPLEQQVARYRSGKGTLKFPLDEPMPYPLIEQLVALLLEQRHRPPR